MACRVKVVGQVERVDGASLSYAEFVRRFMASNRPVVLTGLTSSWRACKDWTLSGPGDRRRPNLGFFTENFPSPLVQVSSSSVLTARGTFYANGGPVPSGINCAGRRLLLEGFHGPEAA